MRKTSVVVLVGATLLGCAGGGSGPPAEANSTASAALTPADLTRPWVKLGPSTSSIVKDAQGYVALVSERITEEKAVTAAYNYLYRSTDGVTWHRATMPAEPTPTPYAYWSLAYGAGRYVVVEEEDGGSTIWASTDLARWSKTPSNGRTLRQAAWANGRFFIFAEPNDFLTSADGVTWTTVPSPLLQGTGVAFGDGAFVVSGVGVRTSRDGTIWSDTTPSCAVTGAACVKTPDGNTIGGAYSSVVFLQDHFYVDQLASTDGTTWQPNPGTVAQDTAGGYLFNTPGGANAAGGLLAWKPGQAARTIPFAASSLAAPLGANGASDPLSAPLANGETCVDHRCVILSGSLYLLR